MKLSTPDILLQAFVLAMCVWAIYNKWIAPRFADRRLLSHLLFREGLRLPPPSEPEPVPVPSPEETEDEEEEPAQFDFYDDVGTEEEEEGLEGDEEEEPEDEEDEGMATHEPSDLTEEDFAEIRKEEERSGRTVTGDTVKPAFPRFLASGNQSDPRAEWNAFVESLLAGTNHLIVIGASGGGKTVTMYDLVRVLLSKDMPVVVCDPDAAQGDWPGADVYGGGDDWQSINGVLKGLSSLMKERRLARTQGIRDFDPMWFVFDEYSDIKDECDAAGTVIENGLRRARKLNIHLMIGVQDKQF
jgi:hypothetical protein